jgi:hypothetical protein
VAGKKQTDIVVRSVDSRFVQSVQGILRRVDVQGQINSGVSQHLHTLVMVCLGGIVDRVDPNGVDAQLFKLGDVALE